MKEKTEINSHRGFTLSQPENTIPAFKEALEHHTELEIDVQETYDNRVIVFHDHTVQRTTNGQGRVDHLTLEEIKRLRTKYNKNVYSDFNGKLSDIQVPTLIEVLESIPNTTRLQIELKDRSKSKTIANLLRQYGFENRFYSSFDPYALYNMQRQDPEVQRLLIFNPGATEEFIMGKLQKIYDFNKLRVQGIGLCSRGIQESTVRMLKGAGYKIGVYVVNSLDDLEMLESWGVDGIVTDRIDILTKRENSI